MLCREGGNKDPVAVPVYSPMLSLVPSAPSQYVLVGNGSSKPWLGWHPGAANRLCKPTPCLDLDAVLS